MNFFKQIGHLLFLVVVVHDLNLVGTVDLPDEAHPPLVVDTDAVLAFAVILQGLQVVARWNTQVIKHHHSVQLQQLAPCNPLEVLALVLLLVARSVTSLSRRSTVGLAGCAPRLVPNRGHPALIPEASGP